MNEHKSLPNGWENGIGESGGKLSDGGYYCHWYYRGLKGSNQHVDNRLECQILAEGNPAEEHVILIDRVEVDDETRILERVATDTIEVDNPTSEQSQQHAKNRAIQRAIELFEKHP